MTTNITILVQRLKVAAKNGCCHTLFPDDCLALVEALEKAQQVDEELCKLLPPGAEYMDPPDGGDVTPLEGVRRMVADYRQRIAALESRTVKLPQRHITQFRKGFNDYHNEMAYKADEVQASLAAAGIKVEAEMKIRIVLQELKEDGVLTTYSNGHVEMLPYRIDENGDEYVEMFPNDIEQH